MTTSVGLFCKSFHRDVSRFERLLESVLAHDADRLPFVLSVPEADRALFSGRFGNAGGRLELVTDEQLVGGSLKQTWRTQQVVKLHSWTLGFADASVLLDSDFCFVRDFGARDFLGDDGTPKFVVSKHWHKYDPANARLLAHLRGEAELEAVGREELASYAAPHREFGRVRRWQPWLDKLVKRGLLSRIHHIRPIFGRGGPELHFMPGPIWTRAMHERFRDEFLAPRRLTYADLVRVSPWEYVWLGEWMVARGLPGATPAEPFFLHFDSDAAIEHARAQGFTKAQVAKRYLGVALASGHQLIEEY